MVKGSAGHRRGGRGFRKNARLLAETVREAGKRAVGSHPAGRRPPVDEREAVAAPASGRKAGAREKERHFSR